ncbi:DUF4328 domain-containing protein [Micromonospora fulviviridis]|uniref:DUF4328 domain-containing protein n=1 Tax=Micromonospora fulviviridis TaxID=47860 RepID=A0ABV2VLM4_9ACTN
MCAPLYAHTFRTVAMQCQTCGDATSPAYNECQRCATPLGLPALLPGQPTYPVRGFGAAAAVAVGAATLLYLPGALFPLIGARMAQSAEARRDGDLLLGAVVAEGLLALLYLVALLVAGVLVIIWTWRVRKNLDAFPGALPSLGPAWAIAGWLVPLANLVVPARVLANVARDSLWRRRTPPLVVLWWAAWLVFLVADAAINKLDNDRYADLAETPRSRAQFAAYVDHYQQALGPRLVPALACLVAGVPFVVLIRRISAAQQDRIAKAAPVWSGWPGHPAHAGWHAHPAWPGHPAWPAPGWPAGAVPAYPVQPVTGVSPQVAGDPSATSPQVPPGSGGTIGA